MLKEPREEPLINLQTLESVILLVVNVQRRGGKTLLGEEYNF